MIARRFALRYFCAGATQAASGQPPIQDMEEESPSAHSELMSRFPNFPTYHPEGANMNAMLEKTF